MILRNVALVVVLAGTAAVAQTATPSAPSAPSVAPMMLPRRAPTKSTWPTNPAAGTQGADALRQSLQDMEGTLTKMHAALKQMRAKVAKSTTKDSLAIANLDMWELMVSHLDKQLQELHTTYAARVELEARRASLYKQADAKSEAQAQAARARTAAVEAATAAPGAQGAQAPAPQTPAAQTPASQAAPASPATTNSPN